MPTTTTSSNPIERIQALTDVARLRLVAVLEREELAVGEAASVVQLPQSTTSRHLKALSAADWIERRTVGTTTLYRVDRQTMPAASATLLNAVLDEVGELDEHAADLVRLDAILAARRTDSISFFGRVSGEWDDIRTELFGDRFTARALHALIPSNWTIADLGCGTGNAAELLAPCVEQVIAIDQSRPMLDAAEKRLERFANVEWRVGSLEALPLEDASVDAAVCALVLHHLDDPTAALAEIRRTLRTDRQGGVLLVIDMAEHNRTDLAREMGHKHAGFSAEQMESMMHTAGFGVVRTHALPTEPGRKGPPLFVSSARI